MSGDGRVRRVGDRGVLVELGDNDEVHRVAAAARDRFGDVLSDVVAGHRTVLLVWPAPPVDHRVVEAICAAGAARTAADRRQTVTVPVTYDGPDLDEVARLAGMSPEEVVRRHAEGRYRAAFVGFAPGFAYLVGVDPALRVPRRRDPRERVAAGSVALAGEYTAVYPGASPGGWQLIGRTSLRMFDADREPPALLEPGVCVDFRAQR